MSDDENHWKWNEFVEIGNNIHKKRGQVRIQLAENAIAFGKELTASGFIRASEERFKLYKTLLAKIAEYLDGNAEVIQTAVKDYFLFQHGKAGLDERLFDISFFPKRSGVQAGLICNVSNGTQTVRYFVKTHQEGPTTSTAKSKQPPVTKELFIYKLLYHIGIGPEPHFIIPSHGTKQTVYIATKDCHLTLLSNLTKDTANNNALLQLDLISRILCLRDCAANTSNCGQVGEKAMIVDFRIEKQFGYAKPDILDKFYEGNSEYNYSGLMAVAVKTPNDVKLEIVRNSLQEWKLLDSIDKAESEIAALVQGCGDKLRFDDDFRKYVEDLKATVQVLMKS